MSHQDLIGQIVKRVRDATGNRAEPVLLHQPSFEGNEWKYVKQCIDTGWVSSAGSFVTEFEKKLCEITGAKYAVAVVNGTAALHVALLLAGVTPDSEVLMPSLTFVATANAARYCDATPHFCDVEERTLGLDARRLGRYLDEHAERRTDGCINRETGRRIAAVVPMHTFGHCVDLATLLEVAEKWRIPIVEDAAESLGSYYHDQHTGTFGRMGILSFNGNKTVTTGAGGAILTNDQALATRARHITTTAKVPHAWEYVHDETGFNYRMPNLNAALGLAQLERLSDLMTQKRALAERYMRCFADLPEVKVFAEPPGTRSNYWLNALILKEPAMKEHALRALNEASLQSRPIWKPMHQLAMYRDCPRMDLQDTEDLSGRAINVPSSACLMNQH